MTPEVNAAFASAAFWDGQARRYHREGRMWALWYAILAAANAGVGLYLALKFDATWIIFPVLVGALIWKGWREWMECHHLANLAAQRARDCRDEAAAALNQGEVRP